MPRHILNLYGKERGAAGVRQYGLRGVGLGLLSLCVALALGPGVPEEIQMAGGGAQVEIETGPDKLVALTFDDGPRLSTTRRLLEGLELREANATFFLVGERIEGCEDLIGEMAEAGHQVGVHTFDHVMVTDLSREDFDLQVGKTRALLTDILGEGEFWLRPPYGIVDESVECWADGPLILWSVDPEDWKDHNAARIAAAVTEQVKDGDIILLHDIYHSSVDAAVQIVDELLRRGFCFVTVEDLLAWKGISPESGAVYRSGR